MDYRDAIDKKAKKADGEEGRKAGHAGYWWKAKEPADRASTLVAAATNVRESASERQQSNLRHARLYGNFDALGFGQRDYAKSASLPQNRISLNVVASCVDTLTSKIAKTRPRPSYLTDGGNYVQQRAARRLDKFWRGVFYETDVYETTREVFRDGCVFDAGAAKVLMQDGRLCFERAFPDDLFVDDADGRYGKPRQMFQRMVVDREVALAVYGDTQERREAIAQAQNPDDAFDRGFGDVIEVWEAWHLRSGKKAKDGIRCVAIAGCELDCEEWDLDCFPFAFFRYSKRVAGFWGQGLAERLSGIQLEINRLLRSISEQLRRKGRCRVYVPMGSKVVAAHLTNGIGDIVYYAGNSPPTVDNVNAIAPEEFLQLDRLYQRAFQEAGVSELSAGSKKPSGLDAAVALREFNDIESERFAIVGQDWEKLHLALASIGDQMLRVYGTKGYQVRVPSRRTVEVVEWNDVKDIDDKLFVRQMFPVSSLPQTPGARLQRIQELEAGGYIDKPTARRLLEFPDIEAENQLAFAAQDDVDATISAIIDDEKPRLIQPDDFTDPLLLIERATAAYLRLKHQKGAEQLRVDMLLALIDSAKAMIAPPAAAPGPTMPGEGMPLPAAAPPPAAPGIDIQNVIPAAPAVPPLIQ